MFVRKGTVRRGRGAGSNRRSGTRKVRTDLGFESCSPIARGEKRTRSLNGGSTSGTRLSPNGPWSASRINESRSPQSSPIHRGDNVFSFDETRISVEKDTVYKPNLDHLKVLHTEAPSPARSLAATVISFDDERQLVRTSVGWENHMNMEGPPDYGALMYQINEARKESDNIVDFGCKTYTIICNTLLVTICVGISLACPIAMVSVGVKYLDDCPKEPRIPIYLLVGGCFGMIKLMSTLWRNIQARRYQDIESVFDDNDVEAAFANTTYRTMDTILFLFLIGWQIAGTYWTAQIWTPNFQQILHEPSNWCDETVYMFSIYQLCCSYFIMVVFVLLLTSLMCCHKCCYS